MSGLPHILRVYISFEEDKYCPIVLYDQLKERFMNSLEHAINIMEEICPSDNEFESDSAEFVDIEN